MRVSPILSCVLSASLVMGGCTPVPSSSTYGAARPSPSPPPYNLALEDRKETISISYMGCLTHRGDYLTQCEAIANDPMGPTLLESMYRSDHPAALVFTSSALGYLDRKDPDRALARARQAVQYDPRNAIAHATIGLIEIGQGSDQGEREIALAKQFDPGYARQYDAAAEAVRHHDTHIDQTLMIIGGIALGLIVLGALSGGGSGGYVSAPSTGYTGYSGNGSGSSYPSIGTSRTPAVRGPERIVGSGSCGNGATTLQTTYGRTFVCTPGGPNGTHNVSMGGAVVSGYVQ